MTNETDPERGAVERPCVVTDVPRNAEARFAALRTPLTDADAFYVRSNFPAPELDPERHRLEVVGAARVSGAAAARSLSLQALRSLAEPVTRVVTLECAGNGRTLLSPLPEGTPWTLGAVGTARFTGVPLSAVLPEPGGRAVEVVFTGVDRGERPGVGEIPFQRSLPVEHLDRTRGGPDEPLLAWAMNGAPLPLHHGAPLRLVVPGWYAVASVKWLARIEVLDAPFEGWFQTDRYRYLERDGSAAPVRSIRVRSLILGVGDRVLEQDDVARPAAGAGAGDGARPTLRLPAGRLDVTGCAWSGGGAIEAVELSVDGGASWREAELEPPEARHARTPWRATWVAQPGRFELVARARDAAGDAQPLEPYWNRLGYGNNVAVRVPVRVG